MIAEDLRDGWEDSASHRKRVGVSLSCREYRGKPLYSIAREEGLFALLMRI